MSTRKVVINDCFGGFSLSEAGVRRYAEIKGIPLWVEPPTGEYAESLARLGVVTYWIVPPEQRPAELADWNTHPLNVRAANNKAMAEASLHPRDLARDDETLVQVVEELGAAASGRHARLAVVEIPADVEWEIAEYDGTEHIAECHRTWYAGDNE